MDKRIFWVIIEDTLENCNLNSKLQEELIKKQLHNFEYDELLDFQVICVGLMHGIYSFEIWAAALAILNECTDDSFTEFRGWLIAQGERAYMNAVNNPDSIYDIITEYDVEGGYSPQMSLDLLVYDVAREKWDVEQGDFIAQARSILNNLGMEYTWDIDFESNEHQHQPDVLKALVPRLTAAYFDEQAWWYKR